MYIGVYSPSTILSGYTCTQLIYTFNVLNEIHIKIAQKLIDKLILSLVCYQAALYMCFIF